MKSLLRLARPMQCASRARMGQRQFVSEAEKSFYREKYPFLQNLDIKETSAMPISSDTSRVSVFGFPNMEPLYTQPYPSKALTIPVRTDILHRAVIYEANFNRYSHASTKNRSEVRGSNRKLLPQKGTGRARVADIRAPNRRGGGIVFGPKPKSYKTDLPSKIYHLACRMAIALRHQRNELFVVDSTFRFPSNESWQMRNLLDSHQWGRDYGMTTFITLLPDKNFAEVCQAHDTEVALKKYTEVRVRQLLRGARLVVEKRAFERIMKAHAAL